MKGMEYLINEIYIPMRKVYYMKQFRLNESLRGDKIEKHARELGRILHNLMYLSDRAEMIGRIRRIEKNQKEGQHKVAFFEIYLTLEEDRKINKYKFLEWLRYNLEKLKDLYSDDAASYLMLKIDDLQEYDLLDAFKREVKHIDPTKIFLHALSDYLSQIAREEK